MTCQARLRFVYLAQHTSGHYSKTRSCVCVWGGAGEMTVAPIFPFKPIGSGEFVSIKISFINYESHCSGAVGVALECFLSEELIRSRWEGALKSAREETQPWPARWRSLFPPSSTPFTCPVLHLQHISIHPATLSPSFIVPFNELRLDAPRLHICLNPPFFFFCANSWAFV